MNNTNIDRSDQALAAGRLLVGDLREKLREIPDSAVDCVVTSPPYFLLRNYQHPDQLGAEATVNEWVANLRDVFWDLARVLKPTASVWLNLGDTYSRGDRYGAPPKSLLLGPERLLLALSADGWVVRNKVVWAKPNPMPASVADRLTCTWEPLYLLTRDRDYFFDLDAIRVPHRSARPAAAARVGPTKFDAGDGKRPAWSGPLAGSNSGLAKLKAAGQAGHPLGKNPGDVWTISTSGYRGAHFAVFPEALVERPLLATCPEAVCATCGHPWWPSRVQRLGQLAMRGTLRKSCRCDSRATQPGVVLDPFMGSGTTAVVAERLGRRWIGIELNPTYADLVAVRLDSGRSLHRVDDTEHRQADRDDDQVGDEQGSPHPHDQGSGRDQTRTNLRDPVEVQRQANEQPEVGDHRDWSGKTPSDRGHPPHVARPLGVADRERDEPGVDRTAREPEEPLEATQGRADLGHKPSGRGSLGELNTKDPPNTTRPSGAEQRPVRDHEGNADTHDVHAPILHPTTDTDMPPHGRAA